MAASNLSEEQAGYARMLRNSLVSAYGVDAAEWARFDLSISEDTVDVVPLDFRTAMLFQGTIVSADAVEHSVPSGTFGWEEGNFQCEGTEAKTNGRLVFKPTAAVENINMSAVL